MREPPEGLEIRELADALTRHWEWTARLLQYVPAGFGAHHWMAEGESGRAFLTVDDLDDRPWLADDPERALALLDRALRTSVALRTRAGLAFVLTPVPARDGRVLVRLNRRFTLTALPWVDGESGEWDGEIGPDRLAEVVRMVAAVHAATDAVRGLPRPDVNYSGRDGLEATLVAVEAPGWDGPLGPAARDWLASRRRALASAVDRHRELADAAAGVPAVVSHGELHPGNLLRRGGEILLIDWDTVAMAPPERDLWMLEERYPGRAAELYRARTGRAVDRDMLELFALEWRLGDAAGALAALHRPHTDDEESGRWWRTLLGVDPVLARLS